MDIPSFLLRLKENGYTVISLIAREGNESVVAQCVKKKLELNHAAIYGYAAGNHVGSVNKLLKQDESLVGSAIAGYARGKHFEPLRSLLKHYPGKEDFAVYGFAQAQDLEDVNLYLNQSPDYLECAIQGFAAVGDTKNLKNYMEGSKYIASAIKAAASNGQATLVDHLLKDNGLDLSLDSIPPRFHLLLNTAMTGYIQGGHYIQAAKLLDKGGNPALAIQELLNVNLDDPVSALHAFLTYVDLEEKKEAVKNLLFAAYKHDIKSSLDFKHPKGKTLPEPTIDKLQKALMDKETNPDKSFRY